MGIASSHHTIQPINELPPPTYSIAPEFMNKQTIKKYRPNHKPNTSLLLGELRLQLIPTDHSCLFHCITYCCNNSVEFDNTTIDQQRKLIADYVLSHRDVYTSDVLGMPTTQYCDVIQRLSCWGSAIELQIFSEIYGCEIYVVDLKLLQLYRFGIDKSYRKRIFLLYTGNHYDVITFKTKYKYNNHNIIRYFSTMDYGILLHIKYVIERLSTYYAQQLQYIQTDRSRYELSVMCHKISVQHKSVSHILD